MFYPESRCFPSGSHSEDSPACCQSDACKWSGGHACGLVGCCPRDLIKPTTHKYVSKTPPGVLLHEHGNSHLHCAMAKTRSLSSSSSLCSRGGPKRKCVIAARPVLRMVGWMFFYVVSSNIIL